MIHIFNVLSTGNSAYLALAYYNKKTKKNIILGHYDNMKDAKNAAKRYFYFSYQQSKCDNYILLWPKYKEISFIVRNMSEEEI